jgi:hypothetical protein
MAKVRIIFDLILSIMATETISAAYFINPSHQSVCLYVYPSYRCWAKLGKCIAPFVTRQRFGKDVSAATNTRNNGRIPGRVCLWVYVPPIFVT